MTQVKVLGHLVERVVPDPRGLSQRLLEDRDDILDNPLRSHQ